MGLFGNKNFKLHGPLNPPMVCPHCHNSECVHTQQVKRKKGISGSKATGALLTLGFSVLATGLSRKQLVTEAWCAKCKNTWEF